MKQLLEITILSFSDIYTKISKINVLILSELGNVSLSTPPDVFSLARDKGFATYSSSYLYIGHHGAQGQVLCRMCEHLTLVFGYKPPSCSSPSPQPATPARWLTFSLLLV